MAGYRVTFTVYFCQLIQAYSFSERSNVILRPKENCINLNTVLYPYFGAMVRLVWSNDPESYAGGNAATGRASNTGQVKGDDPDKKGYPSSPGWAVGARLTTLPLKKCVCFKASKIGNRMERTKTTAGTSIYEGKKLER
jgi:hypothetical protein